MKNKTLIRGVLVGLIVLLAAAYAMFGIFDGRSQPEDEEQDSLSVVVATRYISAFTPISAGDVTVRNFPKGYIPPGALHAVSDLTGDHGIPVYASAVAIPEGQPVTRALLNDLGKSHGMAAILEPGKVAVSFSVDSVRGVGGWIEPGDTIAIFNTLREGDAKAMWRHDTQLLFSSVQVLAVDRKRVSGQPASGAGSESAPEPESGGNVLTVVMNPVEAVRLVEARENGHLSVLLRSLGDEAPWASAPGQPHE